MPLKPYIQAALSGKDLNERSAHEAMGHVMRGEATPAQIAAWLVALRLKRETLEEIVGFAESMRAAMVSLPDAPEGAIDTCGTGGDGLGTFNISTTAALIAASCGVPVAKHGNRSVSSPSGSADVLEALGLTTELDPAQASGTLTETGFVFLFAPRFHPAMRHAAAPRHEIAVRTVFNLLGPLCNPARVRRQIVGVYDRSRLMQIAEVLRALGAEKAMVISGPNGADELLPIGDNLIVEWDGSTFKEYTLRAESVGVPECVLDQVRGGNAQDNAEIIWQIADGHGGPKTETALLNAGAALYVARRAASIAEGVQIAREAVRSGRLAEFLRRIIPGNQER
jgi:anthranilate phosphoribosyltransferase